MKLLILLTAIFLVSCGKQVKKQTKYKDKVVTIEKEVEKVVEVEQKLEGYFTLPFGGSLELLASESNTITITTLNQLLVLKNNTNEYGNLPLFNSYNIKKLKNNSISFYVNLNYTVSNNIRTPSNSIICGVKRTLFTINELKNGSIKIKIQIYNGTSNNDIGTLLKTFNIKSL